MNIWCSARGAWIRPGSPAYTVLYSDQYTGRFSAPHDDNVPLEQRPGISDEPEWLDMIQQAIDGTWTDWRAWNEKLLDVAWGHVLFRQYRVNFESKDVMQQYAPRRQLLAVRAGGPASPG